MADQTALLGDQWPWAAGNIEIEKLSQASILGPIVAQDSLEIQHLQISLDIRSPCGILSTDRHYAGWNASPRRISDSDRGGEFKTRAPPRNYRKAKVNESTKIIIYAVLLASVLGIGLGILFLMLVV